MMKPVVCGCLAVFVVGLAGSMTVPADAIEFLYVDLDFQGYDRQPFCEACYVQVDPKAVNTGVRLGHIPSIPHDIVIIDVLVENWRIHDTSMSDSDFYMTYYDEDGEHHRPYSYHESRIRTDSDYHDDERFMSTFQTQQEWWGDACSKMTGLIPSGGSKVLKMCFVIPSSITDYYTFGMYVDGKWDRLKHFVTINGATCEETGSDVCGGMWDLSRQVVDDGIYTYTLPDTSIYDRAQPGYGDRLTNAVQAGLDAWENANHHVTFTRVHDADNADFAIVMGGSGTSYSTNIHKSGSVNDNGCLVEFDTDCIS